MKIVCTEHGEQRLEEGWDFGSLSVEAPVGLPLESHVVDLVVFAGPDADREEIGISADLVRILAGSPPPDAAWSIAFDAMLRAVAKNGWFDVATRLIRAHVVRGAS